MSALEKGTGFELKLAELFKNNGYLVTHNVKLTGKSGATHQIDILAQFKAPLHTSTVIIEAKSYSANIDKDIIMKLIQIQQDISADRAILATTSDFTPGALQTAQQYSNLELWDRTKITSLLGEMQLLNTTDGNSKQTSNSTKMIESKLSLQDIQRVSEEKAKSRSKGGLFGKGKVEESVVTVKKFLYPYYDVNMEAKIREVEKTGWFSKEEIVKSISSRTGVDANTGTIIDIDNNGIYYGFSYLSNLSEEEISLLYYVSKVKAFEKRNLSSMGWTTTKINKVVNSLTGKGLLVMINARPATYSSKYNYPYDPSIFVSLIESFPVTENVTDELKISISLPAGTISTMFQNFWSSCKIKEIDLVYYPYYMVVFERKDGTKRTEIIDGVTGNRQEYLDGIIPISITE